MTIAPCSRLAAYVAVIPSYGMHMSTTLIATSIVAHILSQLDSAIVASSPLQSPPGTGGWRTLTLLALTSPDGLVSDSSCPASNAAVSSAPVTCTLVSTVSSGPWIVLLDAEYSRKMTARNRFAKQKPQISTTSAK